MVSAKRKIQNGVNLSCQPLGQTSSYKITFVTGHFVLFCPEFQRNARIASIIRDFHLYPDKT